MMTDNRAVDVLARALAAPVPLDSLALKPSVRRGYEHRAAAVLAALTPDDRRVLVAELLDEETLAAALQSAEHGTPWHGQDGRRLRWDELGPTARNSKRADAGQILRALASASPGAEVSRGDTDD